MLYKKYDGGRSVKVRCRGGAGGSKEGWGRRRSIDDYLELFGNSEKMG